MNKGVTCGLPLSRKFCKSFNNMVNDQFSGCLMGLGKGKGFLFDLVKSWRVLAFWGLFCSFSVDFRSI